MLAVDFLVVKSVKLKFKLVKMRDIKFRAWFVGKHDNLTVTIPNMEYDIIIKDGAYALVEGGWDIQGTYPTVPVMQFTGLRDKNDKEIYESDILIDKEVDEYGNDISGYLPVVFCQNTAQWCVDNSFNKDGSHLVNIVEYLGIEHLEVVGNIYENPLLFENENRVI